MASKGGEWKAGGFRPRPGRAMIGGNDAWGLDKVDIEQDPAGAGVPEGFESRHAGLPFMEAVGPIYIRRSPDPLTFGIRIEHRHCNSMMVAHGGMLASVADVVLGIGGLELAEQPGFFITISLNTDFVGPAPIGSWLECRPELIRKTRTMMFVQGVFRADGKPALRANGVFSLPRAPA